MGSVQVFSGASTTRCVSSRSSVSCGPTKVGLLSRLVETYSCMETTGRSRGEPCGITTPLPRYEPKNGATTFMFNLSNTAGSRTISTVYLDGRRSRSVPMLGTRLIGLRADAPRRLEGKFDSDQGRLAPLDACFGRLGTGLSRGRFSAVGLGCSSCRAGRTTTRVTHGRTVRNRRLSNVYSPR